MTYDASNFWVIFWSRRPDNGPTLVFCWVYYIRRLCHMSADIDLSVNYRGSTGFGQDGIESLLGKVGTQDVRDVQVSAVIVGCPN